SRWPLTMNPGISRAMSEAMKWIGGTTVVALVLLGSAVIAGNSLEAEETRPAQVETAAAEIAPAPDAIVPTPAAETQAPPPAPEPFVIKSILPIEGPIRYGEWHWDESAAPAEGQLV